MPIPVTCACGKKLNAPDTLAGKRAKCPTCQKLVLIPEPLELFEDEVELLPNSPQKPPASKTQTRSLPAKHQPTPTAAQATARQTQLNPNSPIPPLQLTTKLNASITYQKRSTQPS
jgi:hypothetical protein